MGKNTDGTDKDVAGDDTHKEDSDGIQNNSGIHFTEGKKKRKKQNTLADNRHAYVQKVSHAVPHWGCSSLPMTGNSAHSAM